MRSSVRRPATAGLSFHRCRGAAPLGPSLQSMSRRVVFLIALISLAILGAAAVPWTLTGSRLSSAVTRHLRASYGLDFAVEGRSTFALLPTPREIGRAHV